MRPSTTKYVASLILSTVVLVTLACVLPSDGYIRYQSLRGTMHERAHWVYERIHFDPTPIDMVVIGPSRASAALDQIDLSRDLSQTCGSTYSVANFSFMQPGLDLAYAVLKETLKAKKVRAIVVGVTEHQGRLGHPAFKDLADAEDVVTEPALVNKGYLSNLAYLPMRQLELTVDSLAPWFFNLRSGFDRSAYLGALADIRHIYPVVDEAKGLLKSGADETFDQASDRYFRLARSQILPAALKGYEFRVEKYYVGQIERLADANGAQVIFVYLPFYKGTANLLDDAYHERGTLLIPPEAMTGDASNFIDPVHLNDKGSKAMSDWVAGSISGDPGLRARICPPTDQARGSP